MAKAVDFEGGTNVTDAWLDELQEVMSALAFGVRLEQASATQYRIPVADDGNDAVSGQSSIIINGLRRYWTAPIIGTMSGGANTYGVYMTAGAGAAPTVTHGTGAAPAFSRKIGEIDWSGTAITAVRQMVDSVSGHGYEHRPGGKDPLDFAAGVAGTAVSLASLTVTGNTVLGDAGGDTVATSGKLTVGGELDIDGALNHDGTTIGLNGLPPVAQSTGWALTNGVSDKVLDADNYSIDEVVNVLVSFLNYMLTRGDIAA